MTKPLPIPLAILLFLAGLQPASGATSAAAGLVATEAPVYATLPDEGPQNPLKRFWTWSDSRLRGVFEAILPDTQERRTLRLSVQPHFSDFLREDHVRLPVGVVYGFNRKTEGEIEVEPYFENPFKDGSMSGIANLRASFKRRWTPAIDDKVDAAAGFSIVRPIAGSPYDLTDGVNRYSIFSTFARPSSNIKDLEGFLNLSYDFITPSKADGEIRKDRPQDDFGKIVTGVLYRKEAVTYGLSLGWEHTFDGETTNFVSITPSVVYLVPRRYTFNMRGQWQVGTAVELRRYGGETDLNVRLRVRWRIDFKKAWREWRERRNGASDG